MILQMKAAKRSLPHFSIKCKFRDFNSENIRNCSMLVYMRDSYLLYADTFAYFTLAGSAEIFFLKTYYHYWSDLKEKSFIVVRVNMSVIWFFFLLSVIFLGLPVLTRCEIMHFVWNQCSDKSIEYTGCDHWEKHLSVQLSYKLKVNILSGYTFIVLRVVCTCVSGQIQSAFICLCTSAYVLLHWTVSDFSIAI